MKTFSPAIGKKAMTVFQEAYPTNPKAMYFLGMPNFVESAFNIMKGFMKDKMKGRLHVRLFCSILQYLDLFHNFHYFFKKINRDFVDFLFKNYTINKNSKTSN